MIKKCYAMPKEDKSRTKFSENPLRQKGGCLDGKLLGKSIKRVFGQFALLC
jgi:hypothetical protein